MQLKNLLKSPLVVTSIIGVVLFFAIIIFLTNSKKVESVQNVSDVSDSVKIESELPIRLKIPKLNIDTKVESVGLTTDGSVDAPAGPVHAGWFDQSSIPGASGVSIIDGHSGWKGNQKAVFDNLHKLKKGDKIYVENESGEVVTFVVREIKSYGKDEEARDVFTSNDQKSHLNLITCSGVWDNIEKSHSERLVVFTDRE